MSTPGYCYIVREYDGHTEEPVVAAFTLKYMLIGYLRKRMPCDVNVTRVRCRDQDIVSMSMAELGL